MSRWVSSSAKARTCGGVPSGQSASVLSAHSRTTPVKPCTASSMQAARHRRITSRTFSRWSRSQSMSVIGRSPFVLSTFGERRHAAAGGARQIGGADLTKECLP